jgi:hypothetical protein
VSGVPRPSLTLVLLLGSAGPAALVGVSMASRMPRALPHGRPARRESVIVSSKNDYSTEAPSGARFQKPRPPRPGESTG